MKIAYDSQIFLMQKYGGISRYFVNLCRYICEFGHKGRIYAPFYINEYLNDFYYGFHINRIPYKSGKLLGFLNNSVSDLLMRNSKSDLIHRTYYFHSQRLNLPQVLTVYDLIHEKFPASFSGNDKTIANKKNSIKKADHIICISKSTQDDLINYYGVAENKTSVVYLGYQLQNMQSSCEDSCVPAVPFLLFVGNRDGYKNFSGFLNAIAVSPFLNDISVVCFGGGQFSKKEMFCINASGLDSSRFIQISGDDALLCELYSKAIAFVYPSKYEGFGLPPLEAMAQGCPVICSNTSSIPEVVGAAGEYFDPYSLESIRVAIERVVFDESRRTELQKCGFERVQYFTWERCARQTLQIYERVK